MPRPHPAPTRCLQPIADKLTGALLLPVLNHSDDWPTVIRKVLSQQIFIPSIVILIAGIIYATRAANSVEMNSDSEPTTAYSFMSGACIFLAAFCGLPVNIYVRCTKTTPDWLIHYFLLATMVVTILLDLATTYFPIRSTCIGLSILAIGVRTQGGAAKLFVTANIIITILVEVRDADVGFNMRLSNPYKGSWFERLVFGVPGLVTLVAATVVANNTEAELELALDAADDVADACDQVEATLINNKNRKKVGADSGGGGGTNKRLGIAATKTLIDDLEAAYTPEEREPSERCCKSCCQGEEQEAPIPERKLATGAALRIAKFLRTTVDTIVAMQGFTPSFLMGEAQRRVEEERQRTLALKKRKENNKAVAGGGESSSSSSCNDKYYVPSLKRTEKKTLGEEDHGLSFPSPVSSRGASARAASVSVGREEEFQQQEEQQQQQSLSSSSSSSSGATISRALLLHRGVSLDAPSIVVARIDFSVFFSRLFSIIRTLSKTQREADAIISERVNTIVRRIFETASEFDDCVCHSLVDNVATVSWGAVPRKGKQQQLATKRELKKNEDSAVDFLFEMELMAQSIIRVATALVHPPSPSSASSSADKKQPVQDEDDEEAAIAPQPVQFNPFHRREGEEEEHDDEEDDKQIANQRPPPTTRRGSPTANSKQEPALVFGAAASGSAWIQIAGGGGGGGDKENDKDDDDDASATAIHHTLACLNFSESQELAANFEYVRQNNNNNDGASPFFVFGWHRYQLPQENAPWRRVKNSDYFFSEGAENTATPSSQMGGGCRRKSMRSC